MIDLDELDARIAYYATKNIFAPSIVRELCSELRETRRDVAELRAGDAMETLAHDEGAIDFLFLDGWNDLYVPLMNLLGSRLSDGALVVVDNASFPGVKAFLERFRALTGFVSSRIESDKGAMEVACFVGPWESIA